MTAAPAPPAIATIVLAAGGSSRFGSPKALARLDGRPILEHVLQALRDARIGPIVVVLGTAGDEIRAGIHWAGDEVVVRNPDPRELSSSLRIGLAAAEALEQPVDGVLFALGDQPGTRPAVIRSLVEAAGRSEKPVVVPRYAEGGGANPVLLLRRAWDLVAEASGDRGLGPVLARHVDLVEAVPVDGANPDVDTPADLAALAWAGRVRANREQVDRVREVPDTADFYATTSSIFCADPRRTDDAVLDALLALARPDDVWLDIGAGAGRYALPLALAVTEVIAVDPSASMQGALDEQAAEAGIRNVRQIRGRWPDSLEVPRPTADVGLMAHVGYDIEAIGPFVEAIEAAVRRRCVAVMTDRTPGATAEPFWPPVHGEPRMPLPALPEFAEFLRAAGRKPAVRMVERGTRRYVSREQLEGFLRGQLWIAEGGEKERRFLALLEELAEEHPDGWSLRGQREMAIGVLTWTPAR